MTHRAIEPDSLPSEPCWQFWIDVGGTFTDVIARRPDGTLLRHKLLSSSVTKGNIDEVSADGGVVDPARRSDPPDFWRGCRLRLLDEFGRVPFETIVVEFDRDSSTLQLADPIEPPPRARLSYEIVAGVEAPIAAIHWLLGVPLDRPLPPVSARLGTTRGTNALLTRRGAKTAFVTTRGFGDVLKIGYQNRPRLFDLNITKPEPLFAAVVEIDERLTPDGETLVAPNPEQIRRQLAEVRQQGIESLAICLLHAYSQPRHEETVERLAREAGFTEISVSHRVAPLMKIVARGDTTVLDAYLNPVLRSYVEKLRQSLVAEVARLQPLARNLNSCEFSYQFSHGLTDLRLLTSAGGLVDATQFTGKDSILSGPAGGVVGFSKVAQAAGFARAIGFDMGGTSTDVSRFDGRFELEYETQKAGVRVVAPMLAIETVAAGGGSICRFDGVKLVVGPDSAGADPGPACYCRGGPLTITDVNLCLGRILPEHFPFPLDRAAVDGLLANLCNEIARTSGARYSPVELADGFWRVANANMARAIRSISVAKGYDPRDYVLVAFGGAAAQHACAVAGELGMTQILNHPDASLLSAYGIGLADVVRHRVAGVYRPLSRELLAEIREIHDRLVSDATIEVLAELPKLAPDAKAGISVTRSLDLRYLGLDAFLTISEPADGNYSAAYENEHLRLYGYTHAGRPVEIVSARVEVIGRSAPPLPASQRLAPREATPFARTTAHFDARPRDTNLFRRADLSPGAVVAGPAIVVEPYSTTVIDPGWQAEVLSGGEFLVTRLHELSDRPDRSVRSDQVADPTLLEIFNNHFAAIAEQMGITLRNTSSSVNVKERLDFSCAIFTATGDLVVNAPHIPVHLGAMGETVKAIIADNLDMMSGDVFVTNDPYRGGSHLPDVTVVSPVHDPATGQIRFFTASRAHHAEIGGITPGSVPPFSKNLAEEGVLIRSFKLIDSAGSHIDELRTLLSSGPYPSRDPETNLADIAAQVAANRQGQRDLQRLVEQFGWPMVAAYMRHIQDAAERKMRSALSRLPNGRREFVDHLDDGSPIAVAITIDGDSAEIDFTGTAPVHAGNLNANRAIVTAAVMYVLRCLIDEDIPLNQGVLAPVKIILPPSLLNPVPPESALSRLAAETLPAVVGGNVETSQRVVDVLLGALGIAAASQGTMNNLLFGDGTFGYYETICGGSGATATAAGADAVHTHMTNTRLTDPEVLERRFPVRVQEFSIRRGSGGAGRNRGGDGIIRRLEFLRELQLSILSQRRGPFAPFGLSGGTPGQLGRNTLRRADRSEQRLAAAVQMTVQPGDIITIETPGGGGFGEA